MAVIFKSSLLPSNFSSHNSIGSSIKPSKSHHLTSTCINLFYIRDSSDSHCAKCITTSIHSPDHYTFPRKNTLKSNFHSISTSKINFSSVRSSIRSMAENSSTSTPSINPGDVSILINGGTGKMGQAVAEVSIKAGLNLIPYAIAGPGVPNQQITILGKPIEIFPSEERDRILDIALKSFPNLIVVDYTLPSAVNSNGEWYCSRGIPFVMGTTGGDRNALLEIVKSSQNYAVIAPQMGKQVVAFLASMEFLAQNFPDAYSGYSLTAVESHQSSKVDTSGTAKEVISCFQKLGIDFSFDQIQKVRTREEQIGVMKVPEEHLSGHAFHTYRIVSPDQTVSFEFQHNVCGRSIYAQGTVDAVLFLAKKRIEGSDQKLFNMIDVLRAGAMR